MTTHTPTETAAWTPQRVRAALAVHYPATRSLEVLAAGQRPLDTTAAAQGLGVSPRTIRRWTSPTTTATYTAAQVQRRIGALLPPAAVLVDERNKLAHFRQGLAWTKRDRNRLPVLWRNNGWLTPHYVYLVQVPGHGLSTVTVTAGGEWARGTIRSDGRVLQRLEFPTRIHAEVHALDLLQQHLMPWRVLAPDWTGIPALTRCWLDTAPLPEPPAQETT